MTETHSTMYFIDKAKKEKKKESLLSLEHSRFFNQSINLFTTSHLLSLAI